MGGGVVGGGGGGDFLGASASPCSPTTLVLTRSALLATRMMATGLSMLHRRSRNWSTATSKECRHSTEYTTM